MLVDVYRRALVVLLSLPSHLIALSSLYHTRNTYTSTHNSRALRMLSSYGVSVQLRCVFVLCARERALAA